MRIVRFPSIYSRSNDRPRVELRSVIMEGYDDSMESRLLKFWSVLPARGHSPDRCVLITLEYSFVASFTLFHHLHRFFLSFLFVFYTYIYIYIYMFNSKEEIIIRIWLIRKREFIGVIITKLLGVERGVSKRRLEALRISKRDREGRGARRKTAGKNGRWKEWGGWRGGERTARHVLGDP